MAQLGSLPQRLRASQWSGHRGAAPRAALGAMARTLGPPWRAATPAGRAAAAMAVGAWLLGLRLGWQELFLVSACCIIALLAAAAFVAGRLALDVSIELDPARVSVGSPAAASLVVVNRSRARLRQLSIEVPVGAGRAIFQLPSLAKGAAHDELFVVPTTRRAVIRVGPARAVRSDPLGLLRRDAVEPVLVELFVHPQIVGLDALSPGLERDLEGQTTRDLSNSDLAFHALRDYVSGDDRRYVHWRSTAKARKLQVRQFQDTRRIRLTVAVDGAAASYRTPDEFEIAMSVAGSVGVRAARNQQDVCLVAAGHAAASASPLRILDTLARGELSASGQDLATMASRAARLAPDTSVLMLVTGSVISFGALQAAAIFSGPDVSVIAIRVEPDAPPGISRSGSMTVLGLRALADLPLLLSAAAGS